jgi:hypothetical protein
MLLNNLLKKTPQEVFIFLERRVNNERCFADVSESYRSNGLTESFELPFAVLPKSELECFGLNADSKLLKLLEGKGNVKFFTHPEMLADYRAKDLKKIIEYAGTISVAPTSSTRTVLSLDTKYPFMIKTDLERKLGDGVKKLKRVQIEHSQKIGKDLKENSRLDFGYLAEPLGFLFSSGDQEVGLIIREFFASPKLNPENYLIPFFSLYSRDMTSPQDPLLLFNIAKKWSNGNSRILDACLEGIITPYIESWASMLLDRGLSMEMHAQNTLLEIDPEGKPIRVVYRDLQDTFVDIGIRERNKLSNDFDTNIAGQSRRSYRVDGAEIKNEILRKQISHSLTYDYRIGRALDYFCQALKSTHKNADSKLTSFVKELWAKKFKGTEVFPKKAYVLEDEQKEINKELNFQEINPVYR